LDFSGFTGFDIYEAASITGNEELIKAVDSSVEIEITESNVVDFVLKTKGEVGIRFAAEHFSSLKSSLLVSELDGAVICRIVNHGRLVVDDEDELLGFCVEYFGRRSDASIFGCVEFSRLKPSSMQTFIGVFPVDHIGVVWASLSKRLLLGVTGFGGEKSERYRVRGRESLFGGDIWKGALQQLKSQHGGNPHELGIIELSASSDYSSTPISSLIDGVPTSQGYGTCNSENSHFIIDFKTSKLSLMSLSYHNAHFLQN
jgi:hypothetical protein